MENTQGVFVILISFSTKKTHCSTFDSRRWHNRVTPEIMRLHLFRSLRISLQNID